MGGRCLWAAVFTGGGFLWTTSGYGRQIIMNGKWFWTANDYGTANVFGLGVVMDDEPRIFMDGECLWTETVCGVKVFVDGE